MLIGERALSIITSDYLSPLRDVAQSALAGIRKMIRNPAAERAKALGTLKRLSVWGIAGWICSDGMLVTPVRLPPRQESSDGSVQVFTPKAL